MTKKIMIIDDDKNILEYIETLFNDNGYKTYTAESGIKARELLKKVKPDIITLDIDMPKEWGPMFFRKLSKNKEFKDIPVIIISGLSSIEHSVKKAAAILQKPFDSKELIKIVKDVIG